MSTKKESELVTIKHIERRAAIDLRLAVVKTEHVVQKPITSLLTLNGHQVEHLTELDGLIGAINSQVATNKDKDSIARRGLNVYCRWYVLNLLELQVHELIHDVDLALEFLILEGEHRLILINSYELGPVGIKKIVVVCYEGLAYFLKIYRHVCKGG